MKSCSAVANATLPCVVPSMQCVWKHYEGSNCKARSGSCEIATMALLSAHSSPPTTPRASGNVSAGQAALSALPGSLAVELRFMSGLVLHILVETTTSVSHLRCGLLRVAGGSVCRDEAILVNSSRELFEEPWHTPFQHLVTDGEVFQVIVRKTENPYYHDISDRHNKRRQ